MEIVNCPKCGKIFTRILNPVCSSCVKDEEKVFEKLKEYITENQECTLSELSENTGVGPRKILRYIREGRLEISKGMRGEIRCEVCSQPINQGRFCSSCMIKINQNISDMFSNYPDNFKEDTKMHISSSAKK